MFEVQIAHTVAEIGQVAWDHLAGGHPFASYRWYRYGETVLADDQPVYILLFRRGEPAARATFWLTRQEPLPIEANVIRRPLEAFLRRRPLLVCRSPLTSTTGLILPESPLREAALRTICRVAQEEGRRRRASFILLPHLEEGQIEWAGWPDTFLADRIPGPDTRLNIQWPDFDSYLRHGLSRTNRKSYRQNQKRAEAMGATICPRPRVSDVDTAMRLIGNVYRRYHSRLEPWLAPMLAHAHMVDATWMTAEVGDEVVACELLIGDGDQRMLTALGIEDGRQYVYFQLLYADIRYAIANGLRVLHGGNGAYDIKQRLGFTIVPNNYYRFSVLIPGFAGLARWLARREAQANAL